VSVLSTDNQQYEELQKRIEQTSHNWASRIEGTDIVVVNGSGGTFPLIPQLQLDINTERYHTFIHELLTLLELEQPTLAKECSLLRQSLQESLLKEWFEASVATNFFYFEEYAKNLSIAKWLPFFIAEHATRPFLQKLVLDHKEELDQADHQHGCVACGEPARLAIISKKGKKELICPRCNYSWPEKKISCAHCGTEDHTKIEILKLEGQENEQIHICDSCKGYTKVIDVRKMIKKESPQLLDHKTIHLDYIAQERGYGIPTKAVTH
jgi:FdhE protein